MKYKIIQTCDATSDYIKLFNLSSMVNKEYCKKWNYEYESFIGLKKVIIPGTQCLTEFIC